MADGRDTAGGTDRDDEADRRQTAMRAWVGAGIGAGIGSAAIAAALLYANRMKKTDIRKR